MAFILRNNISSTSRHPIYDNNTTTARCAACRSNMILVARSSASAYSMLLANTPDLHSDVLKRCLNTIVDEQDPFSSATRCSALNNCRNVLHGEPSRKPLSWRVLLQAIGTRSRVLQESDWHSRWWGTQGSYNYCTERSLGGRELLLLCFILNTHTKPRSNHTFAFVLSVSSGI